MKFRFSNNTLIQTALNFTDGHSFDWEPRHRLYFPGNWYPSLLDKIIGLINVGYIGQCEHITLLIWAAMKCNNTAECSNFKEFLWGKHTLWVPLRNVGKSTIAIEARWMRQFEGKNRQKQPHLSQKSRGPDATHSKRVYSQRHKMCKCFPFIIWILFHRFQSSWNWCK